MHEGKYARGFDSKSDAIDISRTAGEWQAAGDPRMFKLILSPEFGERVDLRRLTRELMTRMEDDLGCSLEWVAGAHFNTEHPHVHVLLRGVASGREIRLESEYVKSGIRKNAEDLCTAQLGYRTEADRVKGRQRETDQLRFTSMDQILQRRNVTTNADPIHQDYFIASIPGDPLLSQRLRVLESAGLAQPLDRFRWRVRRDFEAVLRSMKATSDRQKMLVNCSALISDERLPRELTPPSRITSLEGRVLGHILEDTSGRAHMILEGTDSKVHFIPHNFSIEMARQQRLLRPNNFVQILRGKADSLTIRDFGNADEYLMSVDFASSVKRSKQQTSAQSVMDWGGWLGRYQLALHRIADENSSKDRKAGLSGSSRVR